MDEIIKFRRENPGPWSQQWSNDSQEILTRDGKPVDVEALINYIELLEGKLIKLTGPICYECGDTLEACDKRAEEAGF